jgi:peroxiredoxin
MIRLLSKATATLITLMLLVAVIMPVRATVAVGEAAPDFTAVDSNGVTHKLSDHRGSTVVLEWTNHECPYTVKHYSTGNMQALQKDATGKGIVWLSIISSAPGKQGYVSGEQANELTKSRDAAPSAVLLDPEGTVGRLYGARTTPHMYIIDPAGQLVYAGGIDDKPTADPADVPTATNYVRVALDALAAGRAVDPSTTRPYGCSVKY